MQLDDHTLEDMLTRPATATEVAMLIDEVRTRRGHNLVVDELRQDQAALMQLARSRAIRSGDLDTALREITETAAQILHVGRASVWSYDRERHSIVCLDLYRSDVGAHERGIELGQTDFPAYFDALLEERTIAAHDAHTDPRTSEFSASYLRPLNIESMLDAPVHVGEEMVGVICNEHTSTPRQWTIFDELCAAALADFAALAMYAQRRHETEATLRATIDVAEQRLQTIERQRQAIAHLSAPVIDVWDGILVVPIVGLIDGQRSMELTERLLTRVSAAGARSVIIDLTGVDVIDTMTAEHLIRMFRALALLGTKSMLSGIRPAIAHTLVELGIQLSEVDTVRTLAEGLALCLRRAR